MPEENTVILDYHSLYDNTTSTLDVPVDTPIILFLSIKDKDFKKHVEKGILFGFRHPIVSDMFMKKQLEEDYLFLYHKFNHSFGKKETKENIISLKKDIEFCLEQYHQTKDNCKLVLRIDNDAIDYLQKYTISHKFKFENDKIEMREISGAFSLTPITPNSLLLRINHTLTNTGEKESADYIETVGSFHTHPLQAYQKYNVCMAWPSVDDYITTLHLYAIGYGFFHIVSTLEGIYIISISNKLLKEEPESILSNFKKYEKYMNKNYAIDYPDCNPSAKNKTFWKKEVKKYIKNVNSKDYFHLEFLFWDEAHKNITIHTKPTKNNCVFSDEQIRFVKML